MRLHCRENCRAYCRANLGNLTAQHFSQASTPGSECKRWRPLAPRDSFLDKHPQSAAAAVFYLSNTCPELFRQANRSLCPRSLRPGCPLTAICIDLQAEARWLSVWALASHCPSHHLGASIYAHRWRMIGLAASKLQTSPAEHPPVSRAPAPAWSLVQGGKRLAAPGKRRQYTKSIRSQSR